MTCFLFYKQDDLTLENDYELSSFFFFLQIISDVLQFQGSHKHEFDSRWKSFNLVKKSMENRVSNSL